MKYTRFITTLLTILSATIFTLQAQDQATLRFTGQNQNGQHVTLSTVTVENVSKHWQEMLYYPDTVLTIGPVGIHDPQSEGKGVHLFQNVPNPFDGVTDFVLYLPEASAVKLEICDLNGSVTATYTGSLDQGDNCFRAWLSSPQTYLLSARTEGGTVRIKMVNAGSAGQNRIEYLGKSSPSHMAKSDDNAKGSTNLPFTFGDWMLYQGSAHIAGTDFTSDPVLQMQNGSELITLPFNLPLPTVTTEAATNITPTEARLNGTALGQTDYPIIEQGFQFADNNQLTGATECHANTGDTNFHYTVSNLQVATRYYYRAYAQTEIGAQYGNVLFFSTQADIPEVHTTTVTDVRDSWAICGGNVTSNGGADVISRGVCWSILPDPTTDDSHTTDGSGNGSFTSTITGLLPSTTYHVRAYATNIAGTAYGEELTFTTWPAFYCGIDSATDYDDNHYPTVEIGSQCWMKENLRTTHFPDGAIIPDGSDAAPSMYNPYRYFPSADSLNTPILGYLYNWPAVMHNATSSNTTEWSGVQGICPLGWHVPSKAEFDQLINYLSSQPQYVCGEDNSNVAKALAATTGWQSSNFYCAVGTYPQANNATGFTAYPLGYYLDGIYVDATTEAPFWSATQIVLGGNYGAYYLRIQVHDPNLITTGLLQRYGLPVRCLRD